MAAGLSDHYYARTKIHGVTFRKQALFTDINVVEKRSDAAVRQKVPGNEEPVLSWRQEVAAGDGNRPISVLRL
jgi:hypothetical protein